MPGQVAKKLVGAPVVTEFDGVEDLAELKKLCGELDDETKKLSHDRVQAQLDRDTIEKFYGNTKLELREVELASLLKDKEVELANGQHRVEIRVFQQKVKFLEYEHDVALKCITTEERALLDGANNEHSGRDLALRTEKATLRSKLEKLEDSLTEAVKVLRTSHERSLKKLSEELELMLETLRKRYDDRLAALRDELALRHKVELRDMDERKNSHINQLMNVSCS